MGIFTGDRGVIFGVLAAIGAEQGILFLRYRHQVGEGNTTMDGFRQWKHALRQQPRVSRLHAGFGAAGVIVFYALANIPHLPVVIGVIFGLLVLLSLLYAVLNLAHRDPPLPTPPPPDAKSWEKKMAKFTEGQ